MRACSFVLGATLFAGAGCDSLPSRFMDCASFGQCTTLRLVMGQPDEFTNNRLRTGLCSPQSAVMANNRLIVADTCYNRVLIWNNFPPSPNQPPDVVLGQPDLTTSQVNYDGLSARALNYPTSVDSDGTRLAVADSLNYRILLWNTFPSTSFTPADVVLGQRDFSIGSAPASASDKSINTLPTFFGLFGPGVSFAPSRSGMASATMLTATDPGYNRALFWDPLPVASDAPATGSLGQLDLQSGMSGTTDGRLNLPIGALHSGSIYTLVPDTGNHRVMGWGPAMTNTSSAAKVAVVLGQTRVGVNVGSLPNGGNATPSQSSLNFPSGVSRQGMKTYVADRNNHRIMIWTQALKDTADADLVLGQTAFTTSVSTPVSARSLYAPNAVWSDNSSTVVADTGNHRILVWTSPISMLGQPADRVVGQPVFTTNEQATSPTISERELNYPSSMCRDGKFLVADLYANRVLYWPRLPYSASEPPTLVLGQNDFTSSQSLANGSTGASLWHPSGVACADGLVAVADEVANRVLLWTQPITANAQPADLVLGQPGLQTLTANTNGAKSGLNRPSAVFLWGGKVYVSDRFNSRVLIWNQIPTPDMVQRPPDLVLGQADLTSTQVNRGMGRPSASTLSLPEGLYFDGTRLFVADSGNSRVLIFTKPITSSGQAADVVLGQPDFMTAGQYAIATASTLRQPGGVAVHGERLYVADSENHRVVYWNQIPTQSGQTASGVIGQPDFGVSAANQGGLRGDRLQGPGAVLPTEDGLYIADSGNGRITVLPHPK